MDKKTIDLEFWPKSTVKTFLLCNHFWLVCLIGIIGLATIRSPPVYGKIDFFLLDGRPWWPSWKALIADSRTNDKTPVYTDFITGYILDGVFGEVTLLEVFQVQDKLPTLYIEDMEENKLPAGLLNIYLTQEDFSKDFKCVINLIGYRSSWVPEETGHWHKKMGDTSEFYKFRTLNGESNTRLRLKNFPLKKCAVFTPENNKE